MMLHFKKNSDIVINRDHIIDFDEIRLNHIDCTAQAIEFMDGLNRTLTFKTEEHEYIPTLIEAIYNMNLGQTPFSRIAGLMTKSAMLDLQVKAFAAIVSDLDITLVFEEALALYPHDSVMIESLREKFARFKQDNANWKGNITPTDQCMAEIVKFPG